MKYLLPFPILKYTIAVLAVGMSGSLFSTAIAEDYSLDLTSGVNWNAASWSPSGIPGENDTISNISGSTANLFLNGDRKILSLGKTSSNSTRIYNGVSGNAANNTLTITEQLKVEDGSYIFRGVTGGSSERLTVHVSNLVLGKNADSTTGRISFGSASDASDYRYITFTVSGSTVIKGRNAAVLVSSGLTRQDTHIDLGHVIFQKEDFDVGSPGIEIAGGAAVTVKSLRNTGGPWSRVQISGSGTLIIDGNAGDPKEPAGENNFSLRISDGIRVEKTGSNLQIFSGTNNEYSGGTLISGGVLSVQNGSGSALGKGSVEVRAGGTLAGYGQVLLESASITVKNGGFIAPGADGTEGFNALRINGEKKGSEKILVMEAGSMFSFNLNSAGESDRIQFGYYSAGDLVLPSGGVAINVNGTLSENVTYILFTFNSGAPGEGNIDSGLSEGLVMGTGFDGYIATFHYDQEDFGGPGVIAMTVVAVPEPTQGAVAGLLGGAFLYCLWARRKSFF